MRDPLKLSEYNGKVKRPFNWRILNWVIFLVIPGLLCLSYLFVHSNRVSCGAKPPLVEDIFFSGTPLPGDTTVSISAKATCDPSTALSSVNLTIIGVSAADLVAVGNFFVVPSGIIGIENALDAVIDEGKEFVALYEQPGEPTDTPGDFSVEVSLTEGLPEDALFIIKGIATDQMGSQSSEKSEILLIDRESPKISQINARLLTANNNRFISAVAYLDQDTDVGRVDFTILGSSATQILDVSGILDDVESFVLGKGMSVGAKVSGQSLFSSSIMIPEGTQIPDDGVVLVLAQAHDLSGNHSGMTQVFYTADIRDDMRIEGIEVSPSVALLHGFGDSLQLKVTARVAGGGEVDITQGATGTNYSSDLPAVANVTADGLVTGLSNGSATILVSNKEFEMSLSVTVDESAALTGIDLGPEGLVLPNVGTKSRLTVTGSFSNGYFYDLSPGRLGTEYVYTGPTICDISADGEITATGIGTVIVTATIAALPTGWRS